MMKSIYLSLVLFLISGIFGTTMAQEALKPRPSPMYMSTMKYDDTYIKVTYGRPHKKGRDIFGGLVPYDKVWRTGANEATEITVTDDIYFNGNLLPSGTYSLYTIPGKEKWTIIVNAAQGQWGAYEYDESKDVLRTEVPSATIDEVYEPFTIEFEQEEDQAQLLMIWDQTKVSIPISFP